MRKMGWDVFCEETDKSVHRGQFLRMYQHAADRDAHEALLLPGLWRIAGARRVRP